MPKALAIRSKRLPKSVTRPSRFLPARMKTKFMPVGRPKKRGQTNRTARLANRRMRCLLHVPLHRRAVTKQENSHHAFAAAHMAWFFSADLFIQALSAVVFSTQPPVCCSPALRSSLSYLFITPARFSGVQADRSRTAESHAFVGPCRACVFLRITKAAQPGPCRYYGLL